MKLGRIWMDELPYEVMRIYLADGAFHVICEAEGPLEHKRGWTEYHLHDVTGNLVVSGKQYLDYHESVDIGDIIRLDFKFVINDKEAQSLGVATKKVTYRREVG